MFSTIFACRSRSFLNLVDLRKVLSLKGDESLNRSYGKKAGDDCRRAYADITPEEDPLCPSCERKVKKKKGILHKIKLKIIEGGTNFGTPFRRVTCKDPPCKEEKIPEPKALPAPEKKALPVPESREGVQVSVLGADTAIGQYVALLLKQCSCIKKLRLYEAKDSQCCDSRALGNVVQDLHTIDTNCRVQAFSCSCSELSRCLQNTDIVLMLESAYVNVDMPFDKRFCYQAPIVKQYADCIATECPRAFVVVCASPIDCMVPLIAETMKDTGWYDPKKILGSLAVPEMRASTLAARALCLEPRYTRVPCVGGTEGDALVPLFSKAVEYFDFATHNAKLMTDAVRYAPMAVARSDGACLKAADLSEAHAIAGLVTKVAHALLCHDVPKLTGFVETDGAVITPTRFLANTVELSGQGISKFYGFETMNNNELKLTDRALRELSIKMDLVRRWYEKYRQSSCPLDACAVNFFPGNPFASRTDDAAYQNIHYYLAQEVLLNKDGICKLFDLPPRMNESELRFMDEAFAHLAKTTEMARAWHDEVFPGECAERGMLAQTFFGSNCQVRDFNECVDKLT